MKTILCLALLATVARGAAAQAVPASRAADAAQIKREIEIICQAFVDKDRKVLEDTHGTNWRGFTPESDHVIRGRDGYMNEATFDPQTPKGQGMVGYKISDFDVVFYGDTAVASFVLEVEGRRGTQPTRQKLTILDVFHKEPNWWVQVASNTSYHGDELARRVSESRTLGEAEKTDLLAAREAVWRAWFAGDASRLTSVLAPELITIEPSGFGTLKSNLDASRGFAASGGKLARLVFPVTHFQAYGATVILYTTYEMDLLADGKTRTERGAATEIFVRQNGKWVHTGWQLAPSTR